jgi:hypothetical protein
MREVSWLDEYRRHPEGVALLLALLLLGLVLDFSFISPQRGPPPATSPDTGVPMA